MFFEPSKKSKCTFLVILQRHNSIVIAKDEKAIQIVDQMIADKDFYCLLGEVFFGYRGYFGQDIEGLDDCFSEIYNHKTKPSVQPGASVVFKNSCWLQKTFGEGYFQKITDVFRKHGFAIMLD